jgi:RimJ/RimL family protein N-acetyltransferase
MSAFHWQPPPFPPGVPLEGQWCRLDPLAVAHAKDVWPYLKGQDELWRYLSPPPPQSLAEYEDVLAAMVARTDIVPYAVIDKADGKAKGHFWIMEIRPQHGVFEIGSILWSPAMAKTRLATEAVYLIGKHGFELGYRRYEWKCNDRNEPSKRAALRLGYTFEGLFRQHMVWKGESRDTAWFSIIDSEWPARKKRFEAWLAPQNFNTVGNQKISLSAA